MTWSTRVWQLLLRSQLEVEFKPTDEPTYPPPVPTCGCGPSHRWQLAPCRGATAVPSSQPAYRPPSNPLAFRVVTHQHTPCRRPSAPSGPAPPRAGPRCCWRRAHAPWVRLLHTGTASALPFWPQACHPLLHRPPPRLAVRQRPLPGHRRRRRWTRPPTPRTSGSGAATPSTTWWAWGGAGGCCGVAARTAIGRACLAVRAVLRAMASRHAGAD